MSRLKLQTLMVAAVLAASLHPAAARAQFGFPGIVNLPRNDFRWVWGDAERSLSGRSTDFSINGGEAGFRCELTGRLSPASRMTQMQVRELEGNLRTSLYFIQSSANTMYILDQQRDLDWAVLDCVRPEDRERSAEETQALEDKARERAERRRDRRRTREQQDDN